MADTDTADAAPDEEEAPVSKDDADEYEPTPKKPRTYGQAWGLLNKAANSADLTLIAEGNWLAPHIVMASSRNRTAVMVDREGKMAWFVNDVNVADPAEAGAPAAHVAALQSWVLSHHSLMTEFAGLFREFSLEDTDHPQRHLADPEPEAPAAKKVAVKKPAPKKTAAKVAKKPAKTSPKPVAV